MSWVHEHLPSAAHTKVWQRKFLVLRKMQLQIFASPPVVILQQHSLIDESSPLRDYLSFRLMDSFKI